MQLVNLIDVRYLPLHHNRLTPLFLSVMIVAVSLYTFPILTIVVLEFQVDLIGRCLLNPIGENTLSSAANTGTCQGIPMRPGSQPIFLILFGDGTAMKPLSICFSAKDMDVRSYWRFSIDGINCLMVILTVDSCPFSFLAGPFSLC